MYGNGRMSEGSQAIARNSAQSQRWRFMETAILWEGSLQRSRVAKMFGIAANHVTVDFRDYLAQFPENLVYNHRKQHYEPSANFKPRLCQGDATEYLALLQASVQSGGTNGIASLPVAQAGYVDAAIVPLPQRIVATEILRNVLAAIRNRVGLSMSYRSLSAERKDDRNIWPHALLHGGRSWYVRAFDETNADYRDFALGRIATCTLLSAPRPNTTPEDEAWTNTHTADVIPNPAYPVHAQQVIALDYAMKKHGNTWIWRPQLRECMVKYFVDWYRLGAPPQPKRFQLVLSNMNQLKPYCFPDEQES